MSAKTDEQLRKEYLQCCADVGNIQYQIELLGEEKQKIFSKMHNINFEGEQLAKGKTTQGPTGPQELRR